MAKWIACNLNCNQCKGRSCNNECESCAERCGCCTADCTTCHLSCNIRRDGFDNSLSDD